MAFGESLDKFRNREWGAGIGYLLGSFLFAALWLGLVGYCGYRTYLAIP